MPFRIDLRTMQQPKLWTSEVSDKAKILQKFYDSQDSEGYAQKLAEFREEIALKGATKDEHDFRLTDGKIFEIIDTGKLISVPVQFMVKGSVITWSFTAPKDETHQSWRDMVFNTAAVAHQSVELGCETYYRGSNAYHLKKMHSHSGESDFNHNHYRLKQDHPITPKEVQEHMRAFYNQSNGKKFIPDWKEVEEIIEKFKIYWAEYELDPRYAKYYPLDEPVARANLFKVILGTQNIEVQQLAINDFLLQLGVNLELLPQTSKKLTLVLDAISQLGAMDPKAIEKLYEAAVVLKNEPFPSHYISALVAETHVSQEFPLQDYKPYGELLEVFNEFTARANFCKDFHAIKGIEPPMDNEVNESSPYVVYQTINLGSASEGSSLVSSKSIRSGSPREQYTTAIDQIQTLDDAVEFKLFAQALTNRCRSIDDAMLRELTPEDFRRALRLYNAMKCLNNGIVTDSEGKRFNKSIFDQVVQLKSEISGLVSVEEDPGPAMTHLFNWIREAPPKLEEWIKWVETNGSRGLGSELAHTREVSGQRTRFFGVIMDDRPESVANVSALRPKSDAPKDMLLFNVQQYTGSIMHLMEDRTYQSKAKVGMCIIEILESEKSLSSLEEVLDSNPEWNAKEITDQHIKGELKHLVEETQELLKSDLSAKL
ncbi:MAG: hypothetical protein EBY16_07875 [Gammaproteobacteria bacterium]|nr:hypothetical protein [Gammaproteobacteria bacterium]